MLHLLLENPAKESTDMYRGKISPYRAANSFTLDDARDVCDEFCASKMPMQIHRLGHRCFVVLECNH
jgi:hypothetical protein